MSTVTASRPSIVNEQLGNFAVITKLAALGGPGLLELIAMDIATHIGVTLYKLDKLVELRAELDKLTTFGEETPDA